MKDRSEPLRRWSPRGLVSALCAALLGAAACSGGGVECKTEVTTGAASFTGKAAGEQENEPLRRESMRAACRQKCAAERAPMIDACAAVCVTDIGAQKLGGRTTCQRK